jgi:L-aminopeptidase/D-esterase-like protein
MRNLITDVAGVRVGHSHDDKLISGVTVALFDAPAAASVAVVGGAPAARDTHCLMPSAAVQAVDAIVLSGGSGFGLDAASGVQAWLREQGRGFAVGDVRVPVVPQAICFDLSNGGDKNWGRYPPYRELAYTAALVASDGAFQLGTAGGGYGASTADLKGGVGSASVRCSFGATVGALALVNAIGSAVIGGGPWFWAAPYEVDAEFGGLGCPAEAGAFRKPVAYKGRAEPGTTIALVATDARLDKAQCERLAFAAQGGLAKALGVSHALLDGDTVFAAATGQVPLPEPAAALTELGVVAAQVLARAIARGVYEAHVPGPAWSKSLAHRDRFPRS